MFRSLARGEQPAAVFERAELDLVDDRSRGGDPEQLVDLGDAEVGDADRAGVAALPGLLHARPGPRRPTLRPVDDVQVDVVDAEPPEAVLGLARRIGVAREELGRDEHLLPGDAALAQRPADALLVAVGLRRVDVAVAELERPAHGVLALRPVGYLPDAESQHGNLLAVAELVERLVVGQVALLNSFPASSST